MRTTTVSPEADRPAARWLDAAILLAIIAATTAANLYWLRANVVMVGHDATAYLVASLSYTEFFNRLSPTVLFEGLTYSEYRTPFLYLATQPFFWIFGADADSAQWTNLVTLPVVIVLTYALGRVMADRRAGLVAAAITALLPMMTAMARLYYTEMHLTAVVTVDSRLIEILDVERVLAEIVGVDDTVSANLCEENTSAGRPHHVFVADDSMVARKQITKVLDQIGFTYDVAENGREAWDMLKAAAAEQPILSKYGMVISDIEMPEMDGYTLTKAIKSDSELKSLYVCLHTSLSGSFNQSMAESVGADRLVPKFVADDLALVVREVVLGE